MAWFIFCTLIKQLIVGLVLYLLAVMIYAFLNRKILKDYLGKSFRLVMGK